MATKKQQFIDFNDKLEWEGGITGLMTYGLVESGDVELDSYMSQLMELNDMAENRLYELRTKYGIGEE